MNPVCPYCRTEIGSGEGERLDCPGCATPHHPECFAENGGCTVFGCSKAPADEAKISLTGNDFQPAPQPRTPHTLTLNRGLTLFGPGAVAPASAIPVAPLSPSVPPTPAIPPPPLAPTGTPPPPPPLLPNGSPYSPSYAPSAAVPAVSLSPLSLPSDTRAKSRVAFVLLGLFLGFFGLHNFYAGYNKKGAIQLAITIASFFYAGVVSWVWAIVEVCVINRDSEGELFA